jgi:hypothetical protein
MHESTAVNGFLSFDFHRRAKKQRMDVSYSGSGGGKKINMSLNTSFAQASRLDGGTNSPQKGGARMK